MSEDQDRGPGAPKGNQNARKPDREKVSNRGRITADFGDLKGRCVQAARKRNMKLVPWLREAAEEKLAREGEPDQI